MHGIVEVSVDFVISALQVIDTVLVPDLLAPVMSPTPMASPPAAPDTYPTIRAAIASVSYGCKQWQTMSSCMQLGSAELQQTRP